MSTRVHVRVRLTVGPEVLRGGALGRLITALRRPLRQAWQESQSKLHAQHVGRRGQLAAASFRFSGVGAPALGEPQRAYLEQQLRSIIDGVTGLPPRAPRGAAWREHGYSFTTRFDRFVELVRPVWTHTRYLHELEARHGEHMPDSVAGFVWVIDVTQPVALRALLSELQASQQVRLGPGPFILFRNREYERKLRAIAAGLSELPRLHSDELVYPAGETIEHAQLGAGVRLMFAAVRVPAVSSVPAIEWQPPASAQVAFDELLPLLDSARLQTLYPLQAWPAFLALYADWQVRVQVLGLSLARSVHRDVIEHSAETRARELDPAAADSGLLYELSTDFVQSLPGPLAALVPPPSAAPAPSVDADGYWPKAARGVYLVPRLAEFPERARVAEHADDLRREARTLAGILDLSDGIFSADRYDALWKFLLDWRHERGPLTMEVIWDELERLGKLDSLFTLLHDHYTLDGWMRVAVIQNVIGTRFEQRASVLRLIASMNEIRREIRMQITWDPATGELVFVHSGRRVKPAGTSTDKGAGVIGEVEGYFSQRTVVSRPKRAALDKLAAPTRRKLGELMVAMMCQAGETRTREELIEEAIQAAAKEVKLEEKDFERVRLQLSFRLISVERVTEHGLDQVYVTLQPVRRFADDDWEDAGMRERIALELLDARLESIHVDHLVAALGTFFLVETLVFGGVFVVATGGAVALVELTIAITIRELMYVLQTDEADRDLDGYLTAALYGVVDTLGFRLGGKLAAKLTGRIVTSKALQTVTKQWLVYATKGLAASSALGATQVVEKFADDVFHLSQCRRWSSPWEYFKEFGAGFAVGLTFEFVVIPGLSVAARATIKSLATRFGAGAEEVAKELSQHLSPGDLEKFGEQGAQRLEEALLNTVKESQASWARNLVKALRDTLKDIVEHAKTLPEPKGVLAKLRAEWTSRAVAELFEASHMSLDKSALGAVERLVRTVKGEEMNAIVDSLLKSPRSRLLLSTNPDAGVGLLSGVYKRAPGALEQLLDELAGQSAVLEAKTLAALARLPKLSPSEMLPLLDSLGTLPSLKTVVTDDTVRNVLAHRPEVLSSLLRHPDAVELVERAVVDAHKPVPSVPLAARELPSPLTDSQRALSSEMNASVKPQRVQPEEFDRSKLGDKAYTEKYLDALYKKAAAAQEELTRATKDLARSSNGEPHWRPEPKSRERAWDKLEKYKGDASRLTDLAGTSIVYETLDDLYRGLGQARARFGENIVFFEDRFVSPMTSGYRDVQMNVRMSNGHVAEFRLHLRAIEDVAEDEHTAYEVARALAPIAKEAGRVETAAEEALDTALTSEAQRLYNEALQKAGYLP